MCVFRVSCALLRGAAGDEELIVPALSVRSSMSAREMSFGDTAEPQAWGLLQNSARNRSFLHLGSYQCFVFVFSLVCWAAAETMRMFGFA